ncbi:NAD(P)-binding protein [Patellaria atrata CBS 101060]|uniref:NAD(P)-binding protein n=1 Tax=Patellaria atrata CBS 101060 TaxID=1346257 RepID=A0A9P4VMK3_9PEZI|nr:NAD(P)-binding protein [Patellaria atrata CBS 101060]
MVKIFVQGITGYIGGDGFYALATAHPEYEYTALVRTTDKGAKVAAQFPSVRLVYGGLDDHDLLVEEASKADIVINWADADHEGNIKALLEGLAKHSSPGYFIQTSGTGILMYPDMQTKTFGEGSNKVFDDWEGINEVTSIPDFAPHRGADKLVIEAHKTSATKTAVVCPPCIYGTGRGAVNTRSIQIYDLAKIVLERGAGFTIGKGLSQWSQIHVHDLSDAYVKLVEAAAAGGGNATWGAEGYYFTENGDFEWGQMSKAVTEEAHKRGWIKSTDLDSVTPDEANQLRGFGAYLWGVNSKSKAIRARKLFGWEPTQPLMIDLVPSIVEGEAKALGILKSHAAEAAGDA